MTIVRNTLTDAEGTPAPGWVTARLHGPALRPATQSEIITEAYVQTDAAGYWELDLQPTTVEAPYYVISEQGPSYRTVQHVITVPASVTPLWLGDVTVQVPLPLTDGPAVYQGPPGRSITSTAIDAARHLIVTYSDGTVSDVGSVDAPTGLPDPIETPNADPYPQYALRDEVQTLLSDLEARINSKIEVGNSRIVFAGDNLSTPRPALDGPVLWAATAKPTASGPLDFLLPVQLAPFDPATQVPTGMKATVSGTSAALSVDAVAGATAYGWYDGTTLLATTAGNSYTASGLATGSHTFSATATVGGVASGKSTGVTVTVYAASAYRVGRSINSGQAVATATATVVIPNRTSEIQTIGLGAATAGSITITFAGQTTAAIAYNATATAVQTALEALSNVDPGDITVTGGPLPGTITLTFGGQYAGVDVAQITATPTGLTGGTVTIATTQAGGVLIAVAGDVATILVEASGNTAFETPTGWTLLSGPDYNSTGGFTTALYGKVLVTADLGSTVTLTASASGRLIGTLDVYSDAKLDGYAAKVAIGAVGTSHPAPAIVAATDGAIGHSIWAVRKGATPAPTITLPAGLTAGATAVTAFGASPEMRVASGHDITGNAAGGTLGGLAATLDTSATANTYTLVLPSTAAGPVATVPAPATLDGTVSQGVVTLTWGAVAGATYEVHQAGATNPIAVTTTETWQSGILAQGTYEYWVRAVIDGVTSADSPHKTLTVDATNGGATDPPGAPTGLTYSVSADRKVTLTWNAVVDADSYRVRNKTTGGSVEVAGTTWTSAVLPAGTYSFTVAAIDVGVEGPESAAVTVIVESTGGGGGGGTLLPPRPELQNPITITLSSTNRAPTLDDTKDYIIRAGSMVAGTVTIRGGRRVVVEGGANAAPDLEKTFYGLHQREWLWVEGWHITGGSNPGGLREGFNFAQQYGAHSAVVNCLVDKVHGSSAGHHSDIFQQWAGSPNKTTLLERLEGTSNYQGLMLQPDNFGDGTGFVFILKHCLLRHSADEAGILILEGNVATKYDVVCEDVQLVQPSTETALSYWIQQIGMQTSKAGVRRVELGSESPVLLGKPGVGYVRP